MFGAKAATCHGQKQGFKASTCHRTNYFQIGDIIQDSGSIWCFNDLNIRGILGNHGNQLIKCNNYLRMNSRVENLLLSI